jgi:hypothetical protein
MGRVLIGGTATLLICIFLSPKFTEFLRLREFGQHIREDGPEGHHQKAGTPTMGGVIIFAAISATFLILSNYGWRSVGVFAAALACALLGFTDDYTKLVKRRSLGLRARTKLLVTIAISVGLWWIAHYKVGLGDGLRLRFVDYTIDLGPFYPVLIYLVVAGTTSAVNLTDGLDGHHLPGGHERPRAALRLSGWRLYRLSLVQRVSSHDLHGGYRLAGAGRGDRWNCGHDADRGPAHRARWDLRNRGALGALAGPVLPHDPPKDLPDGPDSSPL